MQLDTVFGYHPEQSLTKNKGLHIKIYERLCKKFGGEFGR